MARKFQVQVRDDFEPLFYDELGRLVVAAGRVEYVLKLCLKTLSGGGFKAGMLKAEQVRHLSSLCDKVTELAKQKLNDSHKGPFLKLVQEIKCLADERNDTVHALWTTTNGREPLRVRPELTGGKGSKKVDWSKTKTVPLNMLREVRRQLEDAYSQLQCQRKSWN